MPVPDLYTEGLRRAIHPGFLDRSPWQLFFFLFPWDTVPARPKRSPGSLLSPDNTPGVFPFSHRPRAQRFIMHSEHEIVRAGNNQLFPVRDP